MTKQNVLDLTKNNKNKAQIQKYGSINTVI